jgi:hypothetical protein
MPTNNRISASLTAADVTAIATAINTIKTKLPFLITLQAADRKNLRKLGQKRQGYYQDVADAVNAFPTALPANFNTVEYLKDAALMTSLMQVAPQLLGLASSLDDTLMQLGSELVTTSDTAYSFLKTAAKNDSSLKPSLDKIAGGLKQKATTKPGKTG